MLWLRFASISRTAYWVRFMSANTLTSSSSRTCSALVMPIRPCRRMPALLTSTSIRPCSLRHAITSCFVNASSRRSPRSAVARPPRPRISTAGVSTPPPRAHSTSTAPSAANAVAIAAPIPRLAPVTSATRSSSSIEGDPVLAQDLARLGHGAHAEDVVRVEHDVEGALEVGDQQHVAYGVPLLERVVGEVVGHP